MSSFFLLELDTTPPVTQIYCPPYVASTSVFDIEIISNEKLMSCQEIVLIDSQGIAHPLTFLQTSDTTLIGEIATENLPLGETTLSVTLTDEVKNESTTYKKFRIINASTLKIISTTTGMKTADDISYMMLNVSSNSLNANYEILSLRNENEIKVMKSIYEVKEVT